MSMQLSFNNIIKKGKSDVEFVNELENRMFVFIDVEKDKLDTSADLDDDIRIDVLSGESYRHRDVQLICDEYKNGMLSYFLKYSEDHNEDSYVTKIRFLEMLNNHDVEDDFLSDEEFSQCYFMSSKTKEGGLSLGGFAECLAYCAQIILGRTEYDDLYDSIALRVCIFYEMWGFAYYDEKNDNLRQLQ